MKSLALTFKNKDNRTLDARLELPVSGKPFAYAIFAHCFTCSKSSKAAISVSRALSKLNIGVMRFDFTGLGESEGEFKNTSFSSNASDITAAANFLRENYSAPQLLIGHSLGGTASIMAALSIPEVNAVATIGSPADPDHVRNLFKESVEEIQEKGEATVDIGGRPFTIKKEFIEDIENADMEEVFKQLDCSFAFLHSPVDEIVNVKNASNLFWKAKHPRSFISLDNANHLLTNNEDAEYAGEMIATWSKKYLKGETYSELSTDKQAVVRIGEEKYYTEILAGNHQLQADEPKKVGGKDLGPTPYDLLVAALGTCTAMTLRMYADRKGWPLEEVFVHLQHSKEHKKDCESCIDENGKLDNITREIKVEGDLSKDQVKRLLEIADRCPVHKTLESGVDIETREFDQ